jgi:hypothetical protein
MPDGESPNPDYRILTIDRTAVLSPVIRQQQSEASNAHFFGPPRILWANEQVRKST